MSQPPTETRIDQIEPWSRYSSLADLRNIRPGDCAACETLITEADIRKFAELSSDVNPLHLDSDIASRYGFQQPVAHGMLALSIISRLIGTQLPGPGSLWVSQDLKFPAPVFAGDRVAGSVTVESVSAATRIVVLRTEVINVRTGKPVITGTARVLVMLPSVRATDR
jgi:acyl dehydratase